MIALKALQSMEIMKIYVKKMSVSCTRQFMLWRYIGDILHVNIIRREGKIMHAWNIKEKRVESLLSSVR